MTIEVNGKEFKKFQKKNITIKKVYNIYRNGYVKSENKFHTYIYFPSRLTDNIVYSEDRIMTAPVEGERMALREQIWNKEERKFEFHKVPKIDLKAFGKVVDIVAVCEDSVSVEVYDSMSKGKVNYILQPGEEFTLKGFSASKLRSLLDIMDLADDVPVNEEGKRPFDWEDNIRKRIEGKAFSYKTTGVGLETRYTFKEVAPMQERIETVENISLEDIPFK